MALSAAMLLALALLVPTTAVSDDWLVDPPTTAVTVTTTTAGGRPAIKMSNGLIARTFITSPNFATWCLEENGEDLLRSLQPEASFQLDNSNASSEVGVVQVGQRKSPRTLPASCHPAAHPACQGSQAQPASQQALTG